MCTILSENYADSEQNLYGFMGMKKFATKEEAKSSTQIIRGLKHGAGQPSK
jgi:hypothetical protein